MKKIIASYLIASTFILSPALQARPHAAPRVILADAYTNEDDTATTDPESQYPIPAAPSDPSQDEQPPEEPAQPPIPEPEASALEATDPEGTPVTAASEHPNKEKSHRWRNIIIAVVAVAVAITALFLIQDNNGHRK